MPRRRSSSSSSSSVQADPSTAAAQTTRSFLHPQAWPVAYAPSEVSTTHAQAQPARSAKPPQQATPAPCASASQAPAAAPRWWPQLAQQRQPRRTRQDQPTGTAPTRTIPRGIDLVDGRYELLGHLGKGGMGHVLRVFDRDMRRHVAMKVLRPDRVARTSDLLARFVEEAQVSSQLEHPNIMPVYDLGLLETGEPYYTMQLVTGRSLAEILEQPRHTRDGLASPVGILSEGVDILGKTLSALAYAHAKGVIHRDLKPDNIMIGRFDEVLVMDWGLSKILRRTPRPDAPAAEARERSGFAPVESVRSLGNCDTREGALAGTLLYMAPEQAHGLSDYIDERTDVWGLGAILYTLLAGRAPHVWGEAIHCNVALLRHAREEPVYPIERGVGNRRVPLGLERIALKALSQDPAQRYANAGEMLEALKYFARSAGWRRRCVVRGWAGKEDLAGRSWTRIATTAAAATLLASLGLAAALLV